MMRSGKGLATHPCSLHPIDVTISLYLLCLCELKYPGGDTLEIDLDNPGAVLKHGFEAINSNF